MSYSSPKTEEKRLPTLLIVDDESSLLIALERYLNKEGFEVLKCSNIDTALKLLDEWSIYAVIIDLHLKEAGLLVEVVRRWHRGLSIILLASEPGKCSELRAAGRYCVQKGEPGSFLELLNVLREGLGYDVRKK